MGGVAKPSQANPAWSGACPEQTDTWANILNEKNLITPGSVNYGSRPESIEMSGLFGNGDWFVSIEF